MVVVPEHSTPSSASPETVLRRSVRLAEELMLLLPLAVNVQESMVAVGVMPPSGRALYRAPPLQTFAMFPDHTSLPEKFVAQTESVPLLKIPPPPSRPMV